MINMRTQHNHAFSVTSAVTKSPVLHPILYLIRDLENKDIAPGKLYVAGGAIAGAVWNKRYNYPARRGIKDINIIYHAPEVTSDAEWNFERLFVHCLKQRLNPEYFGIKIHVRNLENLPVLTEKEQGVKLDPYTSIEDACRRQPTTATAIAVRMEGDCMDVYAPYGMTDLYNSTIAPTPFTEPPYSVGKRGYDLWQQKTKQSWTKLTVKPYGKAKTEELPYAHFIVQIPGTLKTEDPCKVGDTLYLLKDKEPSNFPYIEAKVKNLTYSRRYDSKTVIVSCDTGEELIPFYEFKRSAFVKHRKTEESPKPEFSRIEREEIRNYAAGFTC